MKRAYLVAWWCVCLAALSWIAVPSARADDPPASDAPPAAKESGETQPKETQPKETPPADTKPAEAKTAEAKAGDSKPGDAQQADSLLERIKADPNDAALLNEYFRGEFARLVPLLSADPDAALQGAAAIEAAIAGLEPTDPKAKELMERARASIKIVRERVASTNRLRDLVGKDAAPLNVAAWVNGDPLADADLQGKVVLLDFWAVWCGPCIATFPHLRQWQEAYGDKGLVIVGLTRYYNYEWNEKTNRASRSSDEVTPEAEQEMLVRFAQEHKLQHRFAIQADRELSSYYAVSGIPHVVVIDQQGKIRLVRVGSSPKNAEEISQLLAELLKEE